MTQFFLSDYQFKILSFASDQNIELDERELIKQVQEIIQFEKEIAKIWPAKYEM